MYKVGAAHDDDRKTLVADAELAANVAPCWVPPYKKKTTKRYCIFHDSMTVRSKKTICMNDLLRARISKWVLLCRLEYNNIYIYIFWTNSCNFTTRFHIKKYTNPSLVTSAAVNLY